MSQELSFDVALRHLREWVGTTVEAWVSFADGPDHVTGLHGVLHEVSDETTADARNSHAHQFAVGASGWLRLAPSHDDQTGLERPVTLLQDRRELIFEWYDGSLHIARSSNSSPA